MTYRRFEVPFWPLFARSGRWLMNFVQVHDTRVTIPGCGKRMRPPFKSERTTELCEASTKLHFLSAALWWYQFAFVMPGIGECSLPIPEGPFPLSQSSRAQGLQKVGQQPVERTVRKKLVEATVSQAGEGVSKGSRR